MAGGRRLGNVSIRVMYDFRRVRNRSLVFAENRGRILVFDCCEMASDK